MRCVVLCCDAWGAHENRTYVHKDGSVYPRGARVEQKEGWVVQRGGCVGRRVGLVREVEEGRICRWVMEDWAGQKALSGQADQTGDVNRNTPLEIH